MVSIEQRNPKRAGTLEFRTQAVQRVICSIRNRLDESISLREMAALAYMSRFHFNRTFRQITGLPPRRFLSALRVQTAIRMLLDTDHRVTDICLDVGYNSLGTFIRRFSESLGTSPSRLRSIRQPQTRELLQVAKASPPAAARKAEGLVVGRTITPSSFSGPVFIGLFSNPIPEGAPLACTVQHSSGFFRIARAPRGRHYLFALGLSWPHSISDYFSYDRAIRGGGIVILIEKDETECGDIVLRPALDTDPPILVNLPSLLKTMPSVRRTASSSDDT